MHFRVTSFPTLYCLDFVIENGCYLYMVFLGDLVRLMTAQVCFCVWTIATLCWLAPFQGVLHTAACTVLDLKPHDRMTPAVQELHWLPVAERIQFKLCLLEHKSLFEHMSEYILDLLTSVANVPVLSALHALSSGSLVVPQTHLRISDRAFSVAAP